MRFEISHWPFAGVAASGIFSPVIPMADYERVYIAIEMTQYAGAPAPTTLYYTAIPCLVDGTLLDEFVFLTSTPVMRTPSQTAVGVRAISQVNTTDHPYSWVVVWPAMKIAVIFSTGAAVQLSGIVHVIGVIGEGR
jgi:hypothetical protein